MISRQNRIYMDSPIGLIEIRATQEAVTHLDFVEARSYQEESNPLLEETKRQLGEYFQGKRKQFELPLLVEGTEFQKKVWNELLKIPYGKTLCYGDIAKNIQNEKASRAVGNANNKNKISIIIPCHRVVGASGKLVGYGGGVARKKWLLEHEQARD